MSEWEMSNIQLMIITFGMATALLSLVALGVQVLLTKLFERIKKRKKK